MLKAEFFGSRPRFQEKAQHVHPTHLRAAPYPLCDPVIGALTHRRRPGGLSGLRPRVVHRRLDEPARDAATADFLGHACVQGWTSIPNIGICGSRAPLR